MERKTYTSRELFIQHGDLVELSNTGKISLGIGAGVAEAISKNPKLKPKLTSAAGAYRFWNILAGIAFLYSIYLSFTDQWWWVLAGIVLSGVIANANKSANQKNLIEAAFIDDEFYDRIADAGGWHYRMKPSDAAFYDRQTWKEALNEELAQRDLANVSQ